MAKIPVGVGPKLPQIVVLFGATGDLAHKKLLPGLFHLVSAGFISKCRIIGVSLDAIDAEASAPSPARPCSSSMPITQEGVRGRRSKRCSTTCRWRLAPAP